MLSRLALGEPKGRNAHPAAVFLESAVGATSLCLSLARFVFYVCVGVGIMYSVGFSGRTRVRSLPPLRRKFDLVIGVRVLAAWLL